MTKPPAHLTVQGVEYIAADEIARVHSGDLYGLAMLGRIEALLRDVRREGELAADTVSRLIRSHEYRCAKCQKMIDVAAVTCGECCANHPSVSAIVEEER